MSDLNYIEQLLMILKELDYADLTVQDLKDMHDEMLNVGLLPNDGTSEAMFTKAMLEATGKYDFGGVSYASTEDFDYEPSITLLIKIPGLKSGSIMEAYDSRNAIEDELEKVGFDVNGAGMGEWMDISFDNPKNLNVEVEVEKIMKKYGISGEFYKLNVPKPTSTSKYDFGYGINTKYWADKDDVFDVDFLVYSDAGEKLKLKPHKDGKMSVQEAVKEADRLKKDYDAYKVLVVEKNTNKMLASLTTKGPNSKNLEVNLDATAALEKHKARKWKSFDVDEGLKDEWLDGVNSIPDFKCVSVCSGHVDEETQKIGGDEYPNFNLKFMLKLDDLHTGMKDMVGYLQPIFDKINDTVKNSNVSMGIWDTERGCSYRKGKFNDYSGDINSKIPNELVAHFDCSLPNNKKNAKAIEQWWSQSIKAAKGLSGQIKSALTDVVNEANRRIDEN